MKKILIVNWGTSTAQYPLKEIVARYKNNVYLATTQDIPLNIRKIFNKKNLIFTNPYKSSTLIKDVVAFCQQNKVAFDIVTTLFEMNVYQTSVLADYLSCEYYLPPAAALKTSVNKYLMRTFLEKKHVRQPRFLLFDKSSLKKAFDFFNKLKKDAIIKPIHSGHSYGSRFLEQGIGLSTFENLFAEAQRDLRRNFDEWMEVDNELISNQFLIEEFIEGKMVSCDGVVGNSNEVTFIGTAEFELSNKPWLQQVGHTVPISSLEIKQIKKCKSYVENIISQLGIKYCGFHCELKFFNDEPYLVEISGRLPGGVLLEAHHQIAKVDIFDLFFSIFENKKKKINKNKSSFKSEVIVSMYYPQKNGIITKAKLPELDDIVEHVEIKAVKEGDHFKNIDHDLGIRLIQLKMRSQKLTSRELLIKSRFLLTRSIFKIEYDLSLRLRNKFPNFFNILK